MNLITDEQVKAFGILNNKLQIIEMSIKQRGLEENQRAINKTLTQGHNIKDYELEVEINMYSKNRQLICRWKEDLKPLYLLDEGCTCNIGDEKNYNSVLEIYPASNFHKQKHCWLLSSLYSGNKVSLENILNIQYIGFDIQVKYQYGKTI